MHPSTSQTNLQTSSSIISANDIFSKSFITMQNSIERFSALDILLNLSISFMIGMFIFFVYKKTFQGVLYQRSFNISLVAITMVITLVIMTISGNLILSLGMVGALSIVRFRTPIKDPVDLVFIFWAIAVGIADAVGYFNISLIGSLFITIVLLSLNSFKYTLTPYLLVLHLPLSTDSQAVLAFIKKSLFAYELKSKTITPQYQEITLQIQLNSDDSSFLDQLHLDFDIQKATLISYSGELS